MKIIEPQIPEQSWWRCWSSFLEENDNENFKLEIENTKENKKQKNNPEALHLHV